MLWKKVQTYVAVGGAFVSSAANNGTNEQHQSGSALPALPALPGSAPGGPAKIVSTTGGPTTTATVTQ